jgi:hypothetical protein
MFKSFIDEEKLPLPHSANLYTICVNGTVLDNQCNVVPSYINPIGDLVVNIGWIYGYREYKVALLVAHTFKPLRMSAQYWQHVDILYYDNNPLNTHPSNLIWKFPSKGVESKNYKGFYFIPNFTNYVISRKGEVLQYHTGKLLQGNPHVKGYRYYTLVPDIRPKGKISSVGRHRLLASTFLEYPANIDDLEVNHKNGIPGSDVVLNLEWVTRKENIRHAFENNLRSDNRTVIVTNVTTGRETKYYSAHECERSLGLGRSVVHWRLKHRSGKIFPPGLSFRYEATNKDPRVKKHNKRIKLTLNETGDVIMFPSITQCSQFLKVSKKVIQRRLVNKQKATYKNFLFEVV